MSANPSRFCHVAHFAPPAYGRVDARSARGRPRMTLDIQNEKQAPMKLYSRLTAATLAVLVVPVVAFGIAQETSDVPAGLKCECAADSFGVFTNDAQAGDYTGVIFPVTGFPKPGKCEETPDCDPEENAKCDFSITHQILRNSDGRPIGGASGAATSSPACDDIKSKVVDANDGETAVQWTIFFDCDKCKPARQAVSSVVFD